MEESPRLVTAGYRWHGSQWVKELDFNLHLSCLKIGDDSNAILLLMTRISGQRVGEGGELQKKSLTLPGASSSHPYNKKNCHTKF